MPPRYTSPVNPTTADLFADEFFDATGYARYYTAAAGSAYHTGSDLNKNTPKWDSDAHMPVYAIADGVVTCAKEFPVWGNVVVIDHVSPDGKPLYARYAHVEAMEMYVKYGDIVKRGQQIARIGNASGVQPYHLHFDISRTETLRAKPSDWPAKDLSRVYRDYVDPVQFFADFGDMQSDDTPNPDPEPVTMYTTEENVRVRLIPSIKGGIFDELPAGTEVIVIPTRIPDPASKYNFYRIASGNGYIASEYLSLTKPAPNVRTMWVNTSAGSNLLVRNAPNAAATIVDRLPRGTEVEVTGNAIRDAKTGIDYIQIKGEKRYVALNYLSPTFVDKTPVVVTPTVPAWLPRYDQWGIHANAGGWAPDQAQLDTIRRNNIKTVLIVAYQAGQADRAVHLFQSVGVERFIIRAAVTGDIPGTPQEFIQRTVMTLHEYASALGGSDKLILQIHNEPNLVPEGLNSAGAWKNGYEFAAWFKQVAAHYRANLPGCKIGLPALSPGVAIPQLRYSEELFTLEMRQAGILPLVDWVAVHYYWARPTDAITPPVGNWRNWFGTKPIIATEVGPGINGLTTNDAVQRTFAKFKAEKIPVMHWLLDDTEDVRWRGASWTDQGIKV